MMIRYKFFILWLGLSYFYLEGLTAQTTLTDCLTPLLSADPATGYEDLRFLDDQMKEVIILSLGESTHGTHEFTLMRLKMFQYLVQEHGFSTFFIEDEFSRCLRVDRYIKGADDDAGAVVAQLSHFPWTTEEILAIVQWMRAYNDQQPQTLLNFVGVDMQDGRHLLKNLNGILKKYSASDTIALPAEVAAKTEKEWNKEKAKLFQEDPFPKLKQLGEKLTMSAADRQVYFELLRHLEQNKTYIDHLKVWSYRDFCMGDNILHYLEQQPATKGLFCAHNAHVPKVIKRKKNWKKSWGYAGGVLSEKLGKAHFSIAQDFDAGSFMARMMVPAPDPEAPPLYPLREITIKESGKRSIGELLRSQPDSVLYLSLQDFGAMRKTKGYAGSKKYLEKHEIGAVFVSRKDDPNQALHFIGFSDETFDAIIFFKRSSPTHLLQKDRS